MGFFNRRPAPVAADTTTATGTHHHEKKTGIFGRKEPRMTSHGSPSHNSRPTFGQWIKATALDIVTMAIMGAIGLGVYMADPAPSRSFPITFSDGEIVYPEFAYPLRNEIIPIWAAALMAFFIPFLIFLVVQLRARSFWDVNNATIGLLYSLISAAVFQVFIKWLIGGLRPHFLAVCKPVIPEGLNVGGAYNNNENGVTGNIANGYRQIMFDRSICTGDQNEINDSLESMPSGHTTAAFAGFIFLYLYLNAKLKVFANYHPAMWKLIAIYAPVLGACLIGGALTIDEYHNWYDILAGAVIGTVMAFSSYRMVYSSIWDFRYNHIPLLRSGTSSDGFHDTVWTRKAGWGGSPLHPEGPMHGHHTSHGSTGSRVQRKPIGAHTSGRHGEGMMGNGRHGEQMV